MYKKSLIRERIKPTNIVVMAAAVSGERLTECFLSGTPVPVCDLYFLKELCLIQTIQNYNLKS
jgi:hypothetical protein